MLAISTLLASGCAGAGNAYLPNSSPTALKQQANVIQRGDQDLIYVRGILADTLTFGSDGSMKHVFSDGRVVFVKNVLSGSRQPMILAVCSSLAALIRHEQSQLAWDTAAVILAFGATAAAAFFSFGALGVAGGIATTFVGIAWIEEKTALDNTENSYAAAGC